MKDKMNQFFQAAGRETNDMIAASIIDVNRAINDRIGV
jgi:hypothetical protein